MRAIRQSDIEIAKAEVDILRSLGMEPDREALLLAQLDRPPKPETVEPVVEVNGEAVDVQEAPVETLPVSAGLRPSRRGREERPSASSDEIDIALVLPASDDATMMHIRMENLSGGAQDIIGLVEVAQVDDHFVYSKGVRVGKDKSTNTEVITDKSPTADASKDLQIPQEHMFAEEKGFGFVRAIPAHPKHLWGDAVAEVTSAGRAFRWGKGIEPTSEDTD